MSSSTVSTPAASAATRERSSVSEADSPSGMSTPRTRSGPKAFAQRCATRLESTPPESADDGAAPAEVLVDDLAQALGDLVGGPRRVVEAERLGEGQAQPAPFEPAVFSPTKRVMLAIESRFSGRTSSSAIWTS